MTHSQPVPFNAQEEKNKQKQNNNKKIQNTGF